MFDYLDDHGDVCSCSPLSTFPAAAYHVFGDRIPPICAPLGCGKSYEYMDADKPTLAAGLAGVDPGFVFAESGFTTPPALEAPLARTRPRSPDSQDSDVPREVTAVDDSSFQFDSTAAEVSSDCVRRIHELESALLALQTSRDQVAIEIKTLREQATHFTNGVSQLEETRTKVDHFEWIILQQAKQISTLSAELAKELKSLEQCLAVDDEKTPSVALVSPLRPNSADSPDGRRCPQIGNRLASKSAEDVLELFDVVNEISGAKDMRAWKNDTRKLFGGSPKGRGKGSSGQPGRIPEDDLPVFEGARFGQSLPVTKSTVSGMSDRAFYEVTSLGTASGMSNGTVNSSCSTMASRSGVAVTPFHGNDLDRSEEPAVVQRHGSRSKPSGDVACQAQSPFWKLGRSMPEEKNKCKMLGTSLDCSSLNQHLDADGLEVRERDILPSSVQLESREQRLEFRDFLIEMVANKKAASMYTLYDVEADPPEYARPPPSAPPSSQTTEVSRKHQPLDTSEVVTKATEAKKCQAMPEELHLRSCFLHANREKQISATPAPRGGIDPDGVDAFRRSEKKLSATPLLRGGAYSDSVDSFRLSGRGTSMQANQPLMMPHSMEHGSDDEPSHPSSPIASKMLRSRQGSEDHAPSCPASPESARMVHSDDDPELNRRSHAPESPVKLAKIGSCNVDVMEV